MQKADGMNYAPVSQGKTFQVCSGDEFPFGVIGLEHGHIYAMCNGLMESGAKLTRVYDADPQKVKVFLERYPQALVAANEEEILCDPTIRLVACALRPSRRCAMGLRVMEHDKDYFSDKPGMLTLEEVESARACCARTGRKYMVYFGERVHVEGSVFAQQLIEQGAIGRVLQMTILAPHRLNKPIRPEWFFHPSEGGGILTDIGSHQIEQFMTFCGSDRVRVLSSVVANYANKDHPEFEDFGECLLEADNGATGYFRVDWFTPDGLGAWGDGRVFIVGTEGTIEIRKYINVGESSEGDNVYLVNRQGEYKYGVTGKTGFVFFGQFLRDCMERTETAMTQQHIFDAMEVTIRAQKQAFHITDHMRS